MLSARLQENRSQVNQVLISSCKISLKKLPQSKKLRRKIKKPLLMFQKLLRRSQRPNQLLPQQSHQQLKLSQLLLQQSQPQLLQSQLQLPQSQLQLQPQPSQLLLQLSQLKRLLKPSLQHQLPLSQPKLQSQLPQSQPKLQSQLPHQLSQHQPHLSQLRLKLPLQSLTRLPRQRIQPNLSLHQSPRLMLSHQSICKKLLNQERFHKTLLVRMLVLQMKSSTHSRSQQLV